MFDNRINLLYRKAVAISLKCAGLLRFQKEGVFGPPLRELIGVQVQQSLGRISNNDFVLSDFVNHNPVISIPMSDHRQ